MSFIIILLAAMTKGNFKGGSADIGSQIEGNIHHGREAGSGPSQGSWSLITLHSQSESRKTGML